VNRYLNPPAFIHPEDAEQLIPPDPYLETLTHSQYGPYFPKYLRSDHPVAAEGKHLARILADRLLKAAPIGHDGMRQMLGVSHNHLSRFPSGIVTQMVYLLKSVMSYVARSNDNLHALPIDTRGRLLQWLKIWQGSEFDNHDIQQYSRILSFLIMQSEDGATVPQKIRRQLSWQTNKCAFVGCQLTDNLKACARSVYLVQKGIMTNFLMTLQFADVRQFAMYVQMLAISSSARRADLICATSALVSISEEIGMMGELCSPDTDSYAIPRSTDSSGIR
jgi:hypothetical protein